MTTTPQPLIEELTQPTPAADAEQAAPPPVGPAPGTGEATRDLQRSALRDLVVLSTESAATEGRIEADRVQSLEAAAKEFDKSTFSIRERFKTLEEQVRQKYANRIAKAEAAWKQGVAKAEAEAKRTVQTIEAEAEPISRKLKDKLNHDIWLADSVFDVAQNQFKAEAKKSSDLHESQLKELTSIQEQAVARLAEYGQKAPPAAEGAAEAQAPGTPGQYLAMREAAEEQLHHLGSLFLAKLFVGPFPYIVLIFVCALAGAGAHFILGGGMTPRWPAIGIGAGAMLVLSLVCGIGLRRVGKRQVRAAYQPLAEKLSAARASAKADLDAASAALEAEKAKALQRRDREVKQLTERMAPLTGKADAKRNAALQAAKARRESELTRLKTERAQVRATADASLKKHLAEVAARQESELRAATSRNQAALLQTRNNYQQARSALERRLADGLENIRVPTQPAAAGRIADATGGNGQNGNGDAHAVVAPELPAPIAWDDPAWATWKPPMKFSPTVRFGELLVDLRKKAAESGKGIAVNSAAAGAKLDLPEAFAVPANLAFPQGASLLIQTDREGRDEAIGMLQMAMARLLTWLPVGRVRFIIIDPVGLGQTFSGFMHLADYDEALIGVRIWTENEQIDKRLQDMTEHMETVIQKYLRNEYATIDDYNAQAGELAEPYRFLVLADFPAEFSTEALRRLSSIAVTGPRCGVYTLVIRDTRMDLPSGIHMDELEKSSVNLVRQSPPSPDPEAPPPPPRFVWQDEVFRQFPLTCDAPPTEEQMTKIANIVGHGAKLAKRVEVNFDSIAPKLEEYWTRSTASEMTVPVGRRGATRLQELGLGKGVAQHVLIAGKTGSGKSSLLNALVTNLAMWYSPDEVEFYLIDFKKGVEFKAYASQRLPHARAIAVESDREFGLSVLQRLDGELTRRGDIYRRAGVQDLASYRKVPGGVSMPRTLLLIDEFQEFFSEDDKLAAEASLLLDRLVRQGRAFGIHVLLGSQTIGGNSGLNRSTIGQMAVRVALMTSEADSQVILGDGNSAARLLSRPGEAIYNDQGGLVEANSPFQVAWLPDERREQYLKAVRSKYDLWAAKRPPRDEGVVFEGNMPADITQNKALTALVSAPAWPAGGAGGAARAWVGDPVAIKDPSAMTFRRNSGSNVLLIGQADEAALAILCSAMVSLAAQHKPGEACFYVLDGSSADSPFAGVLENVRTAIPHQSQAVDYRLVPDAMAELDTELKRRQAGGQDAGGAADPEIYVIIYGIQRYRTLRKSEDSFSSFSAGDDEEKKPDPGKIFAEMLRDGPPLGIHVLAWCDTPISVERTFDRGTLREFDNRILFQMSASDSSNLIDSPLANKLGFNRALAYSEEQGTVEKFRPYGPLPKPWLEWFKQQLSARKEKLPAPSVPKPKPAPAAPAPIKPVDAPTPPAEAAAVDASIEEDDDDPGLAEFLRKSGLSSEPAEPASPAESIGTDGAN